MPLTVHSRNGFEQASRRQRQRGFARAVIADQCNKLTLKNFQVDIMDDSLTLIARREVLQIEQGLLIFRMMSVWHEQMGPVGERFGSGTAQAVLTQNVVISKHFFETPCAAIDLHP